MKKWFLFLLPLLLALIMLAWYELDPAWLPEAEPDPSASGVVSTQALTVWFLDVGQGDSALLASGGEYLLIDGSTRESSDFLVAFLENQGVEELKAVVCTHPHADHAGGLPAVLAVYPTQAVYAPTTTYASSCYDDFLYYTDQQGLTVTIPAPGDTLTLGTTVLTVLGPREDYPDTNNTSIVLRADCGNVRFLFTGDMEMEAETDLLDAGTDVKAQVLKVGHHGSSTSTGYRFLYEVEPEYAVISCGAGNSYGHPHEEPLSRLRDAGVTVFRTDTLGTVRADCDGETVSFTWENQGTDPLYADWAGREAEHYIGNRNTHMLHTPDCDSLPAEKNRVEFESYPEAIAAGYTPHGACLGHS